MTKLILIAVLGLAVATANGFNDDDKVVKFFAQTKTFVQLLIAKYLLNEAQIFFCRNSLTLASTRWVRLTLSSLCSLF